MLEELSCSLCNQEFSSEGDSVPRLLPDCGCSFCTACLRKLLEECGEGPLMCPEDG